MIQRFSEFINESGSVAQYDDIYNLTTLRDVVNPDFFDPDYPHADLGEWRAAAVWTCTQFGIGPGPEAQRLIGLQLADTEQVLETMRLEELIVVYDTYAVSQLDAPRLEALAAHFPGLLVQVGGYLEVSSRAVAGEGEEWSTVSAEAWQCGDSGAQLVVWHGEYYDQWFMRRADLVGIR